LLDIAVSEIVFACEAPWPVFEHIVGVPAVGVVRCFPFQAWFVILSDVYGAEVFIAVIAVIAEIIWGKKEEKI